MQEKYCSEAEFRLLQSCLPDYDPVTGLALLWAAKEAAKAAKAAAGGAAVAEEPEEPDDQAADETADEEKDAG